MQRTLSAAGERINAPSVNPVFGSLRCSVLNQRILAGVRCPLLCEVPYIAAPKGEISTTMWAHETTQS
jgi:hypothetical protein